MNIKAESDNETGSMTMIISRTPYRISFFGGGTDFPVWYRENGGAVLSATIDKYNYLNCRVLPPFFDFKYRTVYSKQENVNSIDDIAHPSVRESLKYIGFEKGIAIHHDGDLPARSGIGSSSSFTVGLLHTLYALNGRMVTKRKLALDAIHVEQNLIKESVGSQDQTSAAFGGLNVIEFGGEREIEVQPVIIGSEKLRKLQDNFLLFFTRVSRTASDVEKEKIKNFKNKKDELRAMHSMVYEAVSILNSENCIEDFGSLLNESWKLKKTLSSNVSNSSIDDIYSTAIKSGATGGKILGAGNGGFILFFVKPEYRENVKRNLSGLLHVPFRFDMTGSQIIYYGGDQV